MVYLSANINIQLMGSSALNHNQVTVPTPGTRVQLSATSIPCRSVYIIANKPGGPNSGNIYVGGSGVTSANGMVWVPNFADWFPVDDVSLLYIDADVANDGVCWGCI